jgi:MATE family multidrug resistance protein
VFEVEKPKEITNPYKEPTRSSSVAEKDENSMGFNDDMTTLECFWLVTQIATPPIISMLIYLLVQLVNTYFVGNKNEPELLAGVGMGNMLINISCFAVMQGLSGALETLVSQSFGMKEYTMCGVYLNRGRFVATCFCVPIIFLFTFTDSILIAMGQDPNISKIAQRYCLMMIPGIWAMGMFDCSRKFLAAQFKNPVALYV